MKQYVDIEGSGEGVTTITSAPTTFDGTVDAAPHAEMRWLTVANTSGEVGAVEGGSGDLSSRFTHVTAIGYNGFISNGGGMTLRDVTTPSIDTYGVDALAESTGATVTVQASTIRGANALNVVQSTMDVATSLVDGSVSTSSSTLRCVYDYDANYAPLTTC
jgi:hypothetical protein